MFALHAAVAAEAVERAGGPPEARAALQVIRPAGVLVDATVVRLVLVPAAMEVLGGRNRWFPDLSFASLPLRRNVS